ncbi:MAG: hypothetical protein K2P78_08505 [Gemmataceae bacterium]|nr:hypothetical protein [Gemmataceae bacterium]
MNTIMYFSVVGTRRADLGESVVALLSTEELAREVGRRFMGTRPGLVRCRVRQVHLTRPQVNEIVRQWGRDDAARGCPITDADRLPRPYRDVYLDGYMEPTGE